MVTEALELERVLGDEILLQRLRDAAIEIAFQIRNRLTLAGLALKELKRVEITCDLIPHYISKINRHHRITKEVKIEAQVAIVLENPKTEDRYHLVVEMTFSEKMKSKPLDIEWYESATETRGRMNIVKLPMGLDPA